jgi:hypothetical protein
MKQIFKLSPAVIFLLMFTNSWVSGKQEYFEYFISQPPKFVAPIECAAIEMEFPNISFNKVDKSNKKDIFGKELDCSIYVEINNTVYVPYIIWSQNKEYWDNCSSELKHSFLLKLDFCHPLHTEIFQDTKNEARFRMSKVEDNSGLFNLGGDLTYEVNDSRFLIHLPDYLKNLRSELNKLQVRGSSNLSPSSSNSYKTINSINQTSTETIIETKFDCMPLIFENNDGSKIKIYPNPASSELYIKTTNPNAKTYEIISLLGQTIRSGLIELESTFINTNTLTAGTFFLLIFDDSGTKIYNTKFIKL